MRSCSAQNGAVTKFTYVCIRYRRTKEKIFTRHSSSVAPKPTCLCYLLASSQAAAQLSATYEGHVPYQPWPIKVQAVQQEADYTIGKLLRMRAV